MKSMKPRRKLERQDSINFGQYKGLTIEALCSHRPEYMLQLHDSGDYEIAYDLRVQAEQNISENARDQRGED